MNKLLKFDFFFRQNGYFINFFKARHKAQSTHWGAVVVAPQFFFDFQKLKFTFTAYL